jgi:hypothetical protein
LLRIKPIYNFNGYAWLLSFYLTFRTTLAPLVLFCKFFSKFFCKQSKVYE